MTVADNLKAEEGWRPHVYPDSLGYATIGYGFLIDSRRGDGLPKAVGEFWLAYNIRKITEALTERWPPFAEQPPEVREALEELAYQIGIDGLLKFGKMLEALESGNRAIAAVEALDSLWAKQTPARAGRVAGRLRGV